MTSDNLPPSAWQRLAPVAAMLQQAVDIAHVSEIWKANEAQVYDAKLIYSTREPTDLPVPFRKKLHKLPQGVQLRSQYAHDYMYFLNPKVLKAYEFGGGMKLRMDISIIFDTNTASDIGRFFYDESKTDKKKKVDAAINFIVKAGGSFDYNFYTLENASDYYNGKNVSKIRGRLRDILRLDFIDAELLLVTGKKRSILTDSQLDVAADEKLHAIYDADGRREIMNRFLGIHDLFYTFLLKVIEIQYREEKLKLEQKILELVQFMHSSSASIIRWLRFSTFSRTKG